MTTNAPVATLSQAQRQEPSSCAFCLIFFVVIINIRLKYFYPECNFKIHETQYTKPPKQIPYLDDTSEPLMPSPPNVS